jgi:hypothetical protein
VLFHLYQEQRYRQQHPVQLFENEPLRAMIKQMQSLKRAAALSFLSQP